MLVPKIVKLELHRSLFKPSAYNLIADTPDGDVVVVNTLSGSHTLFPSAHREGARALLKQQQIELTPTNRELVETLTKVGVLVPADSNEQRKLRYLQSHQTSTAKTLHLIVLPTEKCNFRCTYCYEDFAQGKMTPEVRSALKKFMLAQIPSLRALSVDWFGGEPLLAFDVIKDILPDVLHACAQSGCAVSGHITTNGYFLTPEVASQLIDLKVESFQITLDGPRQYHNQRRRLHRPRDQVEAQDDEGTFDRIMSNVKSLLALRRIFNLQLRTNYDRDSLPVMSEWIDEMAAIVGDDPRVRVDFCPIWTDPCKVDVSIALGEEKQRTHVQLLSEAHQRGLRTNAPEYLGLGGLVCYAAKANSLVVRSDGTLNKCTVALEADYNHVGRIEMDGTLQLDVDKFAKWTSSGLEEDVVCQKCSLSAACQGNACPLERFENHKRPCPPAKNFPEPILNMVISTR